MTPQEKAEDILVNMLGDCLSEDINSAMFVVTEIITAINNNKGVGYWEQVMEELKKRNE